jgi:hypothetical protein
MHAAIVNGLGLFLTMTRGLGVAAGPWFGIGLDDVREGPGGGDEGIFGGALRCSWPLADI